MRRATLRLCLIIIGSTAIVGWTEELPVETFFRNYQYAEVKLSPDGNYLGVLAPDKNRVGLAIIDMKNQEANWAFADRLADVSRFSWVKTNRLVFQLASHGYTESGMMAVDRDGRRSVRLVGPNWGARLAVDWGTHFLASLPNNPDEILVTSFQGTKPPDSETLLRFTSVFRMNLYNAKMTLDTANPGRVIHWVTDHNGLVRIGIAQDAQDLTRIKVLHRLDANSKWDTIADYKYTESGIWPVGFQSDNRTLLVQWTGAEDTEAIYTFDVQGKKVLDLGFRHPEADVDELIFSGRKHSAVGVTYDTEKPQVFWFDPQYKHWQEAVDLVLTNAINKLVSTSKDETKAIFLSTTDRNPGTYYLLDTAALRLKKLFDLAEWIHPDQMATMRPIEYKARDGLTIHGYLTLPLGSSGTNLPLVVNPHGGPNVRDTWGFHPDVQFLANRGYAVLRMNFRGSTGYGKSFLKAGFHEWGLKQQDDITDGVKWAIEQGIANPKRICIFGASYGGFAALVGLEQTPELYRCGISYAGVTDIVRTLKKSVPDLKLAQAIAIERVGDIKEDKASLKDISPLAHADKVQAPVFLAYSEYDPLVPIETARDLAKTLKKQGKLYDFMVKDDEAHGFHQETNRIAFWTKVDAFLKANLQN